MEIAGRHYLVIDLEATCWERGDPRQGQNEIIEIGLVILSSERKELWKGGWFVRPVKHPVLSPFCQQLTTIRQEIVDSALQFPEVIAALIAQVVSVTAAPVDRALFVSWGNYDRRQFEQDCLLHECPYPFGEHFNLKDDFVRRHGRKRTGMSEALKVLGLPLLGTHHRGVDDALNISRILRCLLDAGECSVNSKR